MSPAATRIALASLIVLAAANNVLAAQCAWDVFNPSPGFASDFNLSGQDVCVFFGQSTGVSTTATSTSASSTAPPRNNGLNECSSYGTWYYDRVPFYECQSSGDCSGICCNQGTFSRCITLEGGASCSEHSQCASNNCWNNKCEPYPADICTNTAHFACPPPPSLNVVTPTRYMSSTAVSVSASVTMPSTPTPDVNTPSSGGSSPVPVAPVNTATPTVATIVDVSVIGGSTATSVVGGTTTVVFQAPTLITSVVGGSTSVFTSGGSVITSVIGGTTSVISQGGSLVTSVVGGTTMKSVSGGSTTSVTRSTVIGSGVVGNAATSTGAASSLLRADVALGVWQSGLIALAIGAGAMIGLARV